MSRNGTEPTAIPDPEVEPAVSRRQYSAAEKLRIVEEADACTQPGEIGALLRREGIYSSHLSRWRQARDRGRLAVLEDQKRGPKPAGEVALAREVTRLQRENERLAARLEQAEAIIEVQKKLALLLGPSPKETDRSDKP